MRLSTIFTAIWMFVTGGAAMPQDALSNLERIGKPSQDGLNFQPPATSLARDIQFLDNVILVIVTAITIFVLLLIAIVILRYNRRANPNPARFTHHSLIEVIWTVVPIIILIVIGSLSLPRLFDQLITPESDLTLKVTGNQWFWSYEYPEEEIAFDAFMLGAGEPGLNDAVKAELAEYGYTDDEWLLATDNAVVVPVNKVVRVMVTGSDVIHAWKVPAFGVHIDAVPGRLNETWFRAEIEGMYFGQCSELCGKDHSYMPIVVKVVSQEAYDAWLEGAKVEFGALATSYTVASAN